MAAVLVMIAALTAVFIGRPDFLFEDVGSVYMQMLFRSLSFTFVQALASVFFSALIALFVAFSTTLLPQGTKRVATELLRVMGISLFFAPTLVAALTYLKWTTWFEMLPKFGWVPIVLVHVSLNVFFLAHAFAVLMNLELKQGFRAIEISKVFGLSRPKMYWALWARPLALEFYRWLPLVFWWSFSAFTTVLILGGGPRYSSPEVLLFYLLSAGDRPARLFVLILLQLLIGVLALWFARRRQQKLVVQQLRSEVSILGFAHRRCIGEYLVAAAGVFFALSFLLFWLPAVWQALLSLRFDTSVGLSALRSWSILWRSLVLGMGLLALGFVLGQKISKWLGVTLIVSPMVLISVLFQGAWFFETGEAFKLWATASLCLWSTIPVMAFWVFSRQNQFLNENQDLIDLFKPSQKFRLRFFYVPLLGVPVFSYFQIVVLCVLGDVGVVSTIMGSSGGTLAQGIYSKVASYQFDSAFLIFGYLMLSMIPFWALLVSLRRKNEIRTL